MPKANQSLADGLRNVPPREFVRARNALAEKLANDGKTTESRDIRRLPRPSPVVWALNRTAVARPRELNVLVQAMDQLRRTQLGRGDLRATTERYRAAFEPVVRNAVDVLRDAGSAISPALERRIRGTLLAAITDRRLRADLSAGRLSGEHAEPGFAVLSQTPIPAEFLRHQPAKARPARAPIHDVTTKRAVHASELRPPVSRSQRKLPDAEERRQAQQAARAARQVARQAKRGASALRRDARQKERAAQAAETRVETARKALQELEQQGVALRAAADQARDAAAKADERARTTARTD